MGCRCAFASWTLGRLLRWAVATRVRATSARIEAASPRRGGTAASCTGSMALSVRGFDEAAAAPSGGPPLRAASKRPGARQRNEGCSGAAPGTQSKRVVSSNPPLGQRLMRLAHRQESVLGFGPGNRKSPPAGRDTPRGSPRVPHGCPRRGNPHASLMCLVGATACPPDADAASSRRAELQRGRCRTATTADALERLPPPRFYLQRAALQTTSRRSDRWTRTTPKNKYAPQSKGPRLDT